MEVRALRTCRLPHVHVPPIHAACAAARLVYLKSRRSPASVPPSVADQDVVIINSIHRNQLFINDGKGNLAEDGFSTTNMNPTSEISWINSTAGVRHLSGFYSKCGAFGDIDGDGDLDLFIGVSGPNNMGDKLYRNNGAGVFTEDSNSLAAPHLAGQSFMGGGTHSVTFGDVDGDGDLDLVKGGAGSTMGLWLNDGTGAFSYSTTSGGLNAAAVAGSGSLAYVYAKLGDLDGDGGA